MSELLTFALEHEQFRKARLPSLYSDFRYLRTTNPNGFHANITAWKSILADACKSGKAGDGTEKLVLATGEDLISQLQTRDWGRPLALGVVVAESVYSKEFYPLDQFLTQKESIYYWSYVGAALNWGLERIGFKGLLGAPKSMVSGRFVVVKNVEEMAKDIACAMSARSSRTDRIFTKDLFADEFAPGISTTDLKVLLCHLSRDKGECVFDGNTLKFTSPNDASLAPLTEHDKTIAHLKSLLKSLNLRIKTLGESIVTFTSKAQTAVSQKNRAVALAALKSRQTTEAALAQQIKTLSQVESVMAAIQTAADNIELTQIFHRSSKVLSRLNKEIGGVERVDQVMEGLREQTEVADELSRILVEGGVVVDEELVEDELEAMMKEVDGTIHEEKVREELEKIPSFRNLSDSLEGMKLGEEEEERERAQLHA